MSRAEIVSKEVLWYGTGILPSEIWGPPNSRMLHDILDDEPHLQWHLPLIGHTPIFDHLLIMVLITEFDFLPNCTRFPWNICNGCGMPTEDAYSSGHLVLSHFRFACVLMSRPSLSWTCLVSGLYEFRNPSVLLFCLIR